MLIHMLYMKFYIYDCIDEWYLTKTVFSMKYFYVVPYYVAVQYNMFCCIAYITETHDSIVKNVWNSLINDSKEGFVTYLQFSSCFLAGS